MLNTPSRDSVITKVDGYSLLAQKTVIFLADSICRQKLLISVHLKHTEPNG